MNYLNNKVWYKIRLLCFDRSEVSEKIDVNKTRESKECDTCQYWYSLS